MSPNRFPAAAVARLSYVLACTLVVEVVACETPGSGTATNLQAVTGDSAGNGGAPALRPTPAAPFSNVDSASNAQILQYAATLEFVDDSARVDTLRVTQGGRSTLIRISPEIGARLLTPSDLARGRVTARWTRWPDSLRYPMQTMMGFIWTDVGDSGVRLLYVPSDSGIPRTLSRALSVDDTRATDGYPMPRFFASSDSVIGPFGCYYINRRLVCPYFVGLTDSQVTRAYGTRRTQ